MTMAFVPTDKLIWLAAYPRSGVTFLRLVLETCFHVKTDTIYETEPSIAGLGAYNDLADIRDRSGYAFVKTHRMERCKARAIYVLRDGRDAMVSFAHYLRDYAGLTESYGTVLRRVIEGDRTLAPLWSEHVRWWMGREGTAIIRFDDLVRDPLGYTASALRALGVSLEHNGTAAPTFTELRARDPRFFQRGTARDWSVEMPDKMRRLCMKLHGDALQETGYITEEVTR